MRLVRYSSNIDNANGVNEMFAVECGRCFGYGRYDRGLCFRCKGARFTNQKTRPTHKAEQQVLIEFDNGSENVVSVYTNSPQIALDIVHQTLSEKGWKAELYLHTPLTVRAK